MTTDTADSTRHRARLTSQGQITVPKAIRDALGARPGDDVEFVARGDELVVELRRRRSVLDFSGMAAGVAARVPATADELDALIERGMGEAASTRSRRAGRASGGSR